MLKILFFVPSRIDAVDINHEFITRLAHCLSGNADVHVATSAEKNVSDELGGYDILHIFGCWSGCAFMLADKAYRKRIPYIITPLGLLQPWEMKKHGSSMMLRRQRRVTSRAAVINVCGKLEEKTFAKLEWNRRVTLIKNPVLTSQTTFDEVAELFMRLYRKALDSNARVILSEKARQAIGALLQLGLDEQGYVYQKNPDDLKRQLTELSDDDWRYIFIYAFDEEVEEPIKKALDILQYQYLRTDVPSIDRFDTERVYTGEPLKEDVLSSRNLLLRNKVKDTFADRGTTEQQVCLGLLNLHFELNHHCAPLRHLADLYLDMRFKDMDEDMLRDMAKELDMTDFCEMTVSVLSDFLGLAEGFMPFKPKSGRKAKRLLRMLTKFGQYKTIKYNSL